MKSRRSFCESLEQRQLLAGDLYLSSELPAESSPSATSEQAVSHAASSTTGSQSSVSVRGLTSPQLYGYAPTERDLIQESDGLVVAIRTHHNFPNTPDLGPQATLHVFQRQGDGSLADAGTVGLDFAAERIFVTDTSILVVGVGPTERLTTGNMSRTAVRVISRADVTDWTSHLLDGTLESSAASGDRLYVSTSQEINFLTGGGSSEYLAHTVTVFETNESTSTLLASGLIGEPIAEDMIVGNDIIAIDNVVDNSLASESNSNTNFEAPIVRPDPTRRLVRFRIQDNSIIEVAELELAGFYQYEKRITPDGQQAVLVGKPFQSPVANNALLLPTASEIDVSMIDLSGDQPQLFDSITIEGPSGVSPTIIGERAVVIAHSAGEFIVVNTDQTIDIDSESRFTRVAIPSRPSRGLTTVIDLVEVTPNIFIKASRSFVVDQTTGVIGNESELELVTLSLSQQSVTSRTTVSATGIAILSENSREPVLVGLDSIAGATTPNSLAFGALDSTGAFIQDGTIDLSGTLEIDADADRVLLRRIDQVVEYRWDDPQNPRLTALGDAVPQPVAVDDVYTRNIQSHDLYLNVLENDQFVDMFGVSTPSIVELIDAPDGVSISPSDRTLQLSGDLLDAGQTHEFQYVIQQGPHRSTASVNLTLIRYTNDDVRLAIERVVSSVALELNVDESEVIVGSQIAYTQRVMPAQMADGVENPLAGRYGVVVDLVVGDDFYRYAADFGDQMVQLSNRQLQTLMELSLNAVDESGNRIESLKTGDEFFIEVSAKDLRRFGQGVFGVAFDLPLPASSLELTGETVLLGDFDDFGSPLTESGVDEFHAVELLIEHPGNDVQSVVRFGVRAVAGGEVTLQLNPADTVGAELLLRGSDDLVSPLEVDFGSITMDIAGIRPADTDASGAVTPTDALRVINFLGLYGAVLVDDLPTIDGETEPEQAPDRITAMQRLDANADGLISAREAVFVINDLARLFQPTQPGVSAVNATIENALDLDDEDSLAESNLF